MAKSGCSATRQRVVGAAHQQQGHHHWLQAGDGSSVRFSGGDSDSKSKGEETMESPATMTDNHEVGDKEENNVSEAYFDEVMLVTMRRVQ